MHSFEVFSVFEKMLTSDFSEKNADQIDLPSQRREEFGVFLKVIYLDIIPQEKQINDKNYKFLLELADEYQVRKVKHMCCKFLISNVQESNCLGICKLAEEYNLEDVMEKCVEVASLKLCRVLESSEEFLGLNTESKLRVYAKRAKYFDENLPPKYFTQCRERHEDQVPAMTLSDLREAFG